MNDEYNEVQDQEVDQTEEVVEDQEVTEEATEENESISSEQNEAEQTEGEVTEAAPEAQAEQTEEVEEERAPSWVRDLRKAHRQAAKENRELKRQLESIQQPKQTLGKKPTLEDNDYDAEKYEQQLESWYEQKREVEAVANEKKEAEAQQTRQWQDKLSSYEAGKTKLAAVDYTDAEELVSEILDVPQQGLIVNYAQNPAIIVYKLGKNPSKAAELSKIKDPVLFAIAINEFEKGLSKDMKVGRKSPPPPPEKKVGGLAPKSGAIDSSLDRLRKEAEATGDYTKVMSYKRQKRKV